MPPFPNLPHILCIICTICLQLGEDGECDGGNGVSGEADSEEVKRAKLLEVEAVRAAEGGSLGDALELLNQAVTVAPNYASPYNNRAQVRERDNHHNFLYSVPHDKVDGMKNKPMRTAIFISHTCTTVREIIAL